ncbi:hypothetical protein MJG53_007610 [Ovis ammon polii x Ovis aries]|uniref:Uncharacterized protein n=1 Tax=Ovis ammon polii x Ovis aries TaxID=2918886 RepID=A0ACB9V4E4_9CETA|nr:hypothetical protein MJT46_007164 [Ovis ammon polii x Ovis aries]KAI4584331.1 hypothetical protein MJG53_007610 [Ovis ammon polii x Ovis aries]
MRRDPAPGFSMLLFGVSLACYSPSFKSVQDQAYKAPVVVEGKVQGLAPAGGGSSSNSTREPPASGRVALVKVLDKWPLRSGGLQREQVISVGSCAPLERNQRYIFFLEPTEQPLVFKTAFAPLNTNGKNLKKEVGKILCTDCVSLHSAKFFGFTCHVNFLVIPSPGLSLEQPIGFCYSGWFMLQAEYLKEVKDDKGLKYNRSYEKGKKVMDWREFEGRVSASRIGMCCNNFGWTGPVESPIPYSVGMIALSSLWSSVPKKVRD